MDHTEAVDTQAVEKYVLREMTEAEALAFEEHFFECKECADDVAAESVFSDNARAVFADSKSKESETERRSSFGEQLRAYLSMFGRPPVLACATVLFAVITAYQGLILIPTLRRDANQRFREPQQLFAYHLKESVRGRQSIVVPTNTSNVTLSFDPRWEERPAKYSCVLETEDGTRLSSFDVSPPAPGEPIMILFPASDLRSGSVVLQIYGQPPIRRDQTPLGRYVFDVQRP
jgi:hypothetical protein